jgi:NAD(P)-dependent dehydrogenase (short-subunit alcohol dehydrogenase family)
MSLPTKPRAVVTGGASGLGRAFCMQLASKNARILVADIDVEGAKQTALLARERGADAHEMRCDVACAEDVEALAVEAERRFGGTDLVVNNAGVGVSGLVGEIPLDDWKWVLGINLWGVIYGCNAFVPRFKRQSSGAIINVASAAGVASAPEMSAYNVSKAGVIALSETLAIELQEKGISVTVLCPTFIQTNIIDAGRMPDQTRARARAIMQRRSKITADDAAKQTLEALDRKQLYVFPQSDGRWIWRMKRLAPESYFGILRVAQRRGLLSKVK